MNRSIRFGAVALFALIGGCASTSVPDRAQSDGFGVLVMAHGGGPEWNRAVHAAVAPLEQRYPVDVAFGMADPATLQDAVERLEARGVRNIAVVRLFASGASWKERTEQILGIAPGAPPRPAEHAHGEHNHDDMPLWRITTDASFALSTQGLVEAPEMGTVLAERAAALSRDPAHEDVLILAHGPGDDAENARWLAQLEARAEAVRQIRPFRRVVVETLREDWPEQRAAAERRIRAYIERAQSEAGIAIVIPFRVQGFGPYAQVLDRLRYVADGTGLLPHPEITHWIEQQAQALRGQLALHP